MLLMLCRVALQHGAVEFQIIFPATFLTFISFLAEPSTKQILFTYRPINIM
jgi:hypothetical protein